MACSPNKSNEETVSIWSHWCPFVPLCARVLEVLCVPRTGKRARRGNSSVGEWSAEGGYSVSWLRNFVCIVQSTFIWWFRTFGSRAWCCCTWCNYKGITPMDFDWSELHDLLTCYLRGGGRAGNKRTETWPLHARTIAVLIALFLPHFTEILAATWQPRSLVTPTIQWIAIRIEAEVDRFFFASNDRRSFLRDCWRCFRFLSSASVPNWQFHLTHTFEVLLARQNWHWHGLYMFVPTGWKPNQRFASFYVIHGVNGVGWGGIITFIGTSSHIWCYVIVWGGVGWGGIITFIGTS